MFVHWILKPAVFGICVLSLIFRDVATANEPVCAVPESASLKTTLNLLRSLKSDEALQVSVVKVLETKMLSFFNNVKASQKTLSEQEISKVNNVITANLKKVLEKADELQKVIVVDNSFTNTKYGDTVSTECTKKITEYLLHILPKLQVTLSYLFFQVSKRFSSREGSMWRLLHCNGKGDDNDGLKEWLIDSKSVSYTDAISSLLPGGYVNDDLSDKEGSELESKLVGFVDLYNGEGVLPSLLQKLFYITPFTRATTSAFLPYVAALCKNLIHGGITSVGERRVTDEFKGVCSDVFRDLAPLTVHQRNDKADVDLVLLYNGIDEWKGIMGGKLSSNHATWMTHRLSRVLEQLQKMHSESTEWNPSGNEKSKMFGPFTYGFMYGMRWINENWTISHETLPTGISKLLDTTKHNGSLKRLFTYLGGTSNLPEPNFVTPNTTDRSNSSANENGNGIQSELNGLNQNANSHDTTAQSQNQASEPSTNLTGAVNGQEGGSDVKKSPFFTGGIIAIVVVVALVALGGKPGRFVELQDTISGVKEILDGECDDMPEMAFYMVGGLQEAKEKAAEMSKTK
ncbi:ATP synthase subunit beta [Babesia caballi]|uniref:ATP synthase subunit beta n=1 Tax=Babesia caballi TaxID=5871 RepID=A0AAV4M2C8_BABCB|nr:ATP synthase subunit beta [Babesia caballi]